MLNAPKLQLPLPPDAPAPRARRGATQTFLTHAARSKAFHGFVNPPIYRGSTVLFESMDDLVHGRAEFTYGRKGNPSLRALEQAWSELAGAAGTILCGSGLAAITTALLSVARAGDHLLVADTVYGPVRELCDGLLERFGVEVSYFPPDPGETFGDYFRNNTAAVYLESPGSLTMEIQDVPGLASVAHEHGACVLMDNTWSTPLLFDAHGAGVDISIEAGTKYLGGASDLLLGVASANAAYWPMLQKTHNMLGCIAGPEDVFLALRGFRTLDLRIRESGRRALELAQWLRARPEVCSVLHPAFEQSPGHGYWKRDYHGASGLFSVVLEPFSQQDLARMLDGLSLFGMGYSWGGFESLITPIDHDLVRTASPWSHTGPTLRLYIGLEDVEDLKQDLADGFSRLTGNR
ncbi:cystathionine beta-lyase [Thiomonas sp. FB-6]|uniref:cystathionine beta-lyase n=1 Tax=Thiomonas sp. FB-6 TaxID=1158291 RepID=UPI00035ED394|nr:cystathionine beta-lyase [Thiomonas sp. FB-6]